MKWHRVFHAVSGGRLFAEPCSVLCCMRLEDITVVSGGATLVDRVNLHLHCGEILALIGPNGAGKSSLLRALAGEIPYRGKVGFLDARGGYVRQCRLGYVPQAPRFTQGSPATVLDLFTAALSRRPLWIGVRQSWRQRVRELLEVTESGDLLDRRLGDLSGGEVQRVLLALALEPRPNLLLLDEPVSGVDRAGVRRFYAIVDRLRQTWDLGIILVSHDFSVVRQLADRVVLLNQRVLCAGTVAEVFSGEPFRKIWGAEDF